MVSDAHFLGTFLKKNHVSDSGNLLPLDEHMQTLNYSGKNTPTRVGGDPKGSRVLQ